MTLAPMTFLATWMPAVPTPLDADGISSVSHALSCAFRTRIVQQGRNTVGSDAACTYDSESGIGSTLTAGTLTNSA